MEFLVERGRYRPVGFGVPLAGMSSHETILVVRRDMLRGLQVERHICLVFLCELLFVSLPCPLPIVTPIVSYHSCKYRDDHYNFVVSTLVRWTFVVYLYASES